MKTARTDMLDIEELACKIADLDYDEIDADTSIIEEKLIDEFGIDLDGFQQIINRLLPLIAIGKSPITKKTYKGFSYEEEHRWLVKIEI